jgi:hypothetical protein
MTEFVTRETLAKVAAVVPAPHVSDQLPRAEIDRTFELPTGLYLATAALYLGFIAVMGLAFMDAGLVLPMAIFALFIVAGFGTPALWARMNPAKTSAALTWGQLRHRGVQTATGHLDAGAATVQVLILPVLILGWGVAVALIAAVIL